MVDFGYQNALSVMGSEQAGVLRAGCNADFNLFEGRSYSELFARRQSDRVVIRSGQPVEAALPDYRTLDHLMRRKGARVGQQSDRN